MSKIKPERAHTKEIFNGFGGLASVGSGSALYATEMKNFRLLATGALEKRCGWRVHTTLPDTVRGVWQGSFGGVSYLFAVGGATVWQIDADTLTPVGTLSTSSGGTHFVLYRNHLYLLDGADILVWRESAGQFESAHGYAPLYGRNWHPTDLGDINEPLNLFCNRLRVHYFNTTGSTVFVLPYYAASIDKVWMDGKIITDYTFAASDNQVTLPSVGTYIEIAFTILLETEERKRLRNSACGFADRVGEREFLMLYGGGAGQYLFCSSAVNDNMLNSALAYYGDSDPIYCKSSNVLPLSDPDHPITTVIRDRDRMLAFHAGGAASVSVSEEGDLVEGYPLLRGMGCTAGISLSVDGDPVILNEGGIFRLYATASEPDDFEPTLLSDTGADMLTDTFLTAAIAYADTAHGELWFRDPSEVDGTVWVWNTVQKQWYRFDGIYAEGFFTLDGAAGFSYGDQICLFDEDLTTDGGAAFDAVYQSGYLYFKYPELFKRSLRFTLCGENITNNAELTLESEKRESEFLLTGTTSSAPVFFDRRSPLGRFRFLRVTLRDSGPGRSRWTRLALFANL